MPPADKDPRNFIDTRKFKRLETRRVSASETFMRQSPRPSGGAATQLLYGQLFHIHKIGRGWVWGQSESRLLGRSFPGYVGWVRASDLSAETPKPDHKIISLSAPVFQKPDIKSRVLRHLPLNAVISSKVKGKFRAFEGGYIHQEHAAKLSAPSRHEDWISIAESLTGQPYVWGGVSATGLDCSGLVQTALRAFGQDAPRDSGQQTVLGKAIKITPDFSGLSRGDLVFWKGHVGIMTSPTRLLHANAHHMLVAAEPLVTAAARIAESSGPVTAIRRL